MWTPVPGSLAPVARSTPHVRGKRRCASAPGEKPDRPAATATRYSASSALLIAISREAVHPPGSRHGNTSAASFFWALFPLHLLEVLHSTLGSLLRVYLGSSENTSLQSANLRTGGVEAGRKGLVIIS